MTKRTKTTLPDALKKINKTMQNAAVQSATVNADDDTRDLATTLTDISKTLAALSTDDLDPAEAEEMLRDIKEASVHLTALQVTLQSLRDTLHQERTHNQRHTRAALNYAQTELAQASYAFGKKNRGAR